MKHYKLLGTDCNFDFNFDFEFPFEFNWNNDYEFSELLVNPGPQSHWLFIYYRDSSDQPNAVFHTPGYCQQFPGATVMGIGADWLAYCDAHPDMTSARDRAILFQEFVTASYNNTVVNP